MAMKREYLSVDGEIFGEVTNGVVNFYDRDALGSVVAIEDGAGNTVSTIEYKPFGDVRTYTGENPLSSPRRFLWCGTWGYRFNERYAQYTSHYVRARHYSSLQGMWSTVDPLYPRERAYGYVENSPTFYFDSSGLGPCKGLDIRLDRDKVIRNNCKAIKWAAKKHGLPCNLIATTIYLENPSGGVQSGWDKFTAMGGRLGGRPMGSVGIPQITYDEQGSGRWSLSEAYDRFNNRKCCQDAVEAILLQAMIYAHNSQTPYKSPPLELMMKACVIKCMYDDPYTWASEAACHLKEDCESYYSYIEDAPFGPRTLDKYDQALCSAIYNTGKFGGNVLYSDRKKRAQRLVGQRTFWIK